MDDVSETDRRTISRYLALDEDLLYTLIPPHLAESESLLFDEKGQEDQGRKLFGHIRARLQKAVCHDFDWPAKKNNPAFNDPVILVASIADVISGLTINVPPFVVATLLVKQGLNRLCASYDSDTPPKSDDDDTRPEEDMD